MQDRSDQGLLDSSLAVIDDAFSKGADVMAALLSGGHDSLSALFTASQHPKWNGEVFHIDTGIGAKATRAHVEDTCREYGWNLTVLKSPSTYEMFVRDRGFPGPGMHQWAYVRLKERCVRMIMRHFGKAKVALITGCRSQESTRRMGHVEPLKIGEQSKRGVVNKRRYWVAPCHDWSSQDQNRFMSGNDLPINPIKRTPLGMSGECFCGAFARPNEIAMVRQYAPDVATEIDRLTDIARQLGKHDQWGTRPDRRKGVVVAKSGPLCNSCDTRAMAAGLIIDQSLQCDLRE